MNIAGSRPVDIITINTDPIYYCSCCKKDIENTYSKRLFHLKTSLHRKNRNNIHKILLYNCDSSI